MATPDLPGFEGGFENQHPSNVNCAPSIPLNAVSASFHLILKQIHTLLEVGVFMPILQVRKLSSERLRNWLKVRQ